MLAGTVNHIIKSKNHSYHSNFTKIQANQLSTYKNALHTHTHILKTNHKTKTNIFDDTDFRGSAKQRKLGPHEIHV